MIKHKEAPATIVCPGCKQTGRVKRDKCGLYTVTWPKSKDTNVFLADLQSPHFGCGLCPQRSPF